MSTRRFVISAAQRNLSLGRVFYAYWGRPATETYASRRSPECASEAVVFQCFVSLCAISLCFELGIGLRQSAAQVSANTLPQPPTLTFDELVTMSRQEPLNPELKSKLEQVLQTPVVWNNPAAKLPQKPVDGGVGPVFRVAEWNIERGIEFESIEQALTSSDAFESTAQQAGKLSPAAMTKLRDQVATLRGADVFILNEVDIGVKRSDYRNVIHDLAESLGMNSAYAVEFLEVDPLVDLGTEAAVLDSPELSAKMTADLKPDKDRFRGMHVNAILSRYPIRSAKVIELPVCHDWYNDEQKGISQIEKAKRVAADKVFLERIGREVRRGNRNALLVSLDVPGAPNDVFTVVNVHLENKGKANLPPQADGQNSYRDSRYSRAGRYGWRFEYDRRGRNANLRTTRTGHTRERLSVLVRAGLEVFARQCANVGDEAISILEKLPRSDRRADSSGR